VYSVNIEVPHEKYVTIFECHRRQLKYFQTKIENECSDEICNYIGVKATHSAAPKYLSGEQYSEITSCTNSLLYLLMERHTVRLATSWWIEDDILNVLDVRFFT
jgi:hypothetical protein